MRIHRNKRMQIKYLRSMVCGRWLRVRLRLKENRLLTYPVLNKQERSHENNQTNKALQQQWESISLCVCVCVCVCVKWEDFQQ